MARMNNPMFQQTGSPLDGLNQGVAALFQSLMSQPSAADRAKSQAELDYLRARTNAANLDVRQAAGQQAVGQQISDLFIPQEAPRPDPGFEGPMPQRPVGDVLREGLPAVYGNAMAYGMKPSDVASTVMGMAPWAAQDDVTRANAYVGTGKPLGVNDAFSLEGQDAIASRNAGFDLNEALAVQRAKPVEVNAGQDVYFGAEEAGTRGLPTRLSGRHTETTARGDAFLRLPEDKQAMAVGPTRTEFEGATLADNFFGLDDLSGSQREVLGANQSPSASRAYMTPDGQEGTTLDGGLTDAHTGEALPQGTQTHTKGVQAADVGGLRPHVVGNIQENLLALADMKTTFGRMKETAAGNPSIFGAVGNVRRFGQNVMGQWDALSAAFGMDRFDEVASELQSKGVSPEFFDPSLSNVDKLATLAAYQAAAVVGQTGKGLSDNDFRTFRRLIGDPTAWLSTEQSFIAGLTEVESLAEEMIRNRHAALGQDSAPAATQGESGVADAMTPPADGGSKPRYDINGNRIQ